MANNSLASTSLDKGENLRIINIPKIAFRSFIDIADGCKAQTFCYLLGPPQKTEMEDVWIDTVVIPKQISSVSFVEDNGIEDQDTITYLREHSLSKCKQIFA